MAWATVMPLASVRASSSGCELAGDRERGEKREAEAHALFFGEGDEFDVEGQRRLVQFFEGGEREDDAERAVEGAGVGDGVDVREEDERGRVRFGSWANGAEVAGVVGAGFESGLAQPPGEQGVGVARGGREEEARGLAGDVGDARELAAAGDDAGGAGCLGRFRHGQEEATAKL